MNKSSEGGSGTPRRPSSGPGRRDDEDLPQAPTEGSALGPGPGPEAKLCPLKRTPPVEGVPPLHWDLNKYISVPSTARDNRNMMLYLRYMAL